MHRNVVIAGFARSPFHFAQKGALAKVRPDDMAAQVVEALIARTGVPAEDVEDVIVGCAFPEGEQGMNMARLIALLAHLPIATAGTTVNRFCGSSMQAIHMAAGAIKLDAGHAFVCAGVELDCARGHVDRLHRGAAEAVDRGPRRGDRQVRQKRDQARHVHALLAFREGAADDHVLDVLGRHAGARDQGLDHLRRQIVGPDLGERALLREMERRAREAGDHDVSLHRTSPLAQRAAAGRTTFKYAVIWVIRRSRSTGALLCLRMTNER